MKIPGARLALALALSALTACSSKQNPSQTDASLTDSSRDSGDARACDADCGVDADTNADSAKGDSGSLEAADGDDSTDASDAADFDVDATEAAPPYPWYCPRGQPFGAANALAWPFAITGTERLSATGQSVVWRAAAGANLSIADYDDEAGTFTQLNDIQGTSDCGDFDISPDGLDVVCVTSDGANLESTTRALVGTNFGTPDTSEFANLDASLPFLPGLDGGTPQISHPIFASGTLAILIQVQGVGIVSAEKIGQTDSWPPVQFLVDPGTLTLDGAHDTSVLFLWDSTAQTTSIDWQFLDGHWELDPLGAQMHVTPNIACTGAYYLLNSALDSSSW